ncbi:MAG: chaperone modulator CbpM [Bacteroidetes bacterium]|nr:chaperone modulator CbpM [Bacteroidota bacterium]
MTNATLITAADFCSLHHVEYTFIDSLSEAGLVELTIVGQTAYVPDEQMPKLEKMIRLHHELEINVAGIGAITHLLQQLDDIREEMRMLRNKLNRYEDNF